MSNATETLLSFLSKKLSEQENFQHEIACTSMHPRDTADGKAPQVNLYLYHLAEETNLRNVDTPHMSGKPTSPALNYHYLLTAYDADKNIGALELLKKAGMSLLEKPQIETNEGKILLEISNEDLGLDSLTNLWQALQTPLLPCFTYIVRERSR